MAKVVIKSLKSKAGEQSAVGKKSVLGPDGTAKEVLTVDASSPSFGEDLRVVFESNVEKASREYARIVGIDRTDQLSARIRERVGNKQGERSES